MTPTAFATTGILMPLLQHRIRVLFNSTNIEKLPNDVLTMQVRSINYDFNNSTATIEIESSVFGLEGPALLDLMNRPFTLCTEALNGESGNALHQIVSPAKIINHSYKLDYAGKSTTAVHVIEVELGNIEFYRMDTRN